MKRILSISLAVCLLLCLMGCKAQDEPILSEPAAIQTAPQMEVASTVTGEVESIVGNEVTLNLGEVEKSAAPAQNGDVTQAEAPQMPDDGEMPDGMEFPANGEMPERGEMPEGGMGGGRGQSGEKGGQGGMGSMSGQNASQAAEIKLSGETAKYILPVGMNIGSGDYSSVTSGMVLELSLDADGNVIACSILSR